MSASKYGYSQSQIDSEYMLDGFGPQTSQPDRLMFTLTLLVPCDRDRVRFRTGSIRSPRLETQLVSIDRANLVGGILHASRMTAVWLRCYRNHHAIHPTTSNQSQSQSHSRRCCSLSCVCFYNSAAASAESHAANQRKCFNVWKMSINSSRKEKSTYLLMITQHRAVRQPSKLVRVDPDGMRPHPHAFTQRARERKKKNNLHHCAVPFIGAQWSVVHCAQRNMQLVFPSRYSLHSICFPSFWLGVCWQRRLLATYSSRKYDSARVFRTTSCQRRNLGADLKFPIGADIISSSFSSHFGSFRLCLCSSIANAPAIRWFAYKSCQLCRHKIAHTAKRIGTNLFNSHTLISWL